MRRMPGAPPGGEAPRKRLHLGQGGKLSGHVRPLRRSRAPCIRTCRSGPPSCVSPSPLSHDGLARTFLTGLLRTPSSAALPADDTALVQARMLRQGRRTVLRAVGRRLPGARAGLSGLASVCAVDHLLHGVRGNRVGAAATGSCFPEKVRR